MLQKEVGVVEHDAEFPRAVAEIALARAHHDHDRELRPDQLPNLNQRSQRRRNAAQPQGRVKFQAIGPRLHGDQGVVGRFDADFQLHASHGWRQSPVTRFLRRDVPLPKRPSCVRVECQMRGNLKCAIWVSAGIDAAAPQLDQSEGTGDVLEAQPHLGQLPGISPATVTPSSGA